MDSDLPEFVAGIGVRAGDILAGKYRVDRVLGVGGTGLVTAGEHLQLKQQVAIKFLLPHAAADADLVARFIREARAAVRIKSEHVARVMDVGTMASGAPYMVMEYLDGSDLAAWLRDGVLSVDLAVEFVLQACDAIAEAHGLGIVHRDLKPANLFCIRGRDGLLSVKVLDFGISKFSMAATARADPPMRTTASRGWLGSPYYMSPEQVSSPADVDPRTDIWSLGVILYELLTGAVPFGGSTLLEVSSRIGGQPLPPLREHRPDVPRSLEDVVTKCLQKDRDQRFSSIGELVEALAPFAPKQSGITVDRIRRLLLASRASGGALGPAMWEGPGLPTSSRTLSSSSNGSSAPRRHRTYVVGAAALGFSIAALWASTVGRLPIGSHSAVGGEASPDDAGVPPAERPPAGASAQARSPIQAAQEEPADAGTQVQPAAAKPPLATIAIADSSAPNAGGRSRPERPPVSPGTVKTPASIGSHPWGGRF